MDSNAREGCGEFGCVSVESDKARLPAGTNLTMRT